MATVAAGTGTLPTASDPMQAAPITSRITNILTLLNEPATVADRLDENNVDYSSADGIVTMQQTQTITGAKTFSAALQLNNTVTVGVDDTGHDVKFFGATSGKSWLWDESADTMIVTGAATISETLGVTGVLTMGGNIVSDTDSTDDLGTTSVRWANLYVDSIGDTGQDLTIAATTTNLPSGHVFDYNGADVTITHAANVLAIEGGNVGIGTTSPAVPLEVDAAAGELVRLDASSGSIESYLAVNTRNAGNGVDASIQLATKNGAGINKIASVLMDASAETLVLTTNSTAALSIDQSQRVIIASIPTSDPAVSGALWSDGGTIKISA